MLPLFMKPRFISLKLLYNMLFTSLPLPSRLSYRGVIPDTNTSVVSVFSVRASLTISSAILSVYFSFLRSFVRQC